MVYKLADDTRARRRKLRLQRSLVPDVLSFFHRQTSFTQMILDRNKMILSVLEKDEDKAIKLAEVTGPIVSHLRELGRASWFDVVRKMMKLRTLNLGSEQKRKLMKTYREVTEVYLSLDNMLSNFWNGLQEIIIDL